METIVFSITPVSSSEEMSAYLETTVVEHILERSPKLTSQNLIYQLKNPHVFYKIPDRAHFYEFTINSKASLIGQTVVPCVFYDRHQVRIKQELVYVDVDWVGPVVISTRYIRKGEIVVTDDVRLVVRSLRSEPSNHLSSLDQVVGYEIARAVPEGVTMTSWSVRLKPLIRRGEKVFLLTGRSNVQLRVMGVALEDGVVDQSIRVKTLLDKSKIMRGTIKDHETVEIDLLY